MHFPLQLLSILDDLAIPESFDRSLSLCNSGPSKCCKRLQATRMTIAENFPATRCEQAANRSKEGERRDAYLSD